MGTEQLLEIFLTCTGVSIDTRSLQSCELFFALKGPNFDGNLYIEQALEKGAQHAISDNPAFVDRENVTVVDDCLSALQQLATAYRNTWDCPVVGLTGSNGKTTTKELLAAMLATTYRVYATAGNLNNHIGVPLSLLRAPANAEIVVIEMGANHVGEIAELSNIARPTHGFITNIGKAHLEGFGGLEGVRRGKGELFDFLKHKGQSFINASDPEIMALHEKAGRHLFFGSTNEISSAFEGHLIFEAELLQDFPVVEGKFRGQSSIEPFTSQLPGAYNFQNILVSAAVAFYFKVPLERIAEATKNYTPSNSRSEILKIGESSVLFDAYNANPDSIKAALSWIASRKEQKKVIILGELAELGAFAKTEHANAVQLATEIRGSEVAFFGKAYQEIGDAQPVFTEVEELKHWLKSFLGRPETVILLKGSRSNRLERLIEV
jgi:UDP-N-acetylmuramoyl-tripeptide--D-alanyl-D-alanine ligase